MKNKSGFTLIELVVVIVILGILAASAVPKFMDLQKDAQISALNGMLAALKSSNNMIYSKSILARNSQSAAGFVCIANSCSGATDDNYITIAYGYPTANANGIVKTIEGGMDTLTTPSSSVTHEWIYSAGSGTSAGRIYIFPAALKDSTTTSPKCRVEYYQATATTNPVYTLVTDDCQ